jgi:RNA polymerase sigma-70 factor (ECF subfamily)
MPDDFGELYAGHVDQVWRYVRARVPDHHEAEDVTAEVFARALRAWERYDPARGTIGAWLVGIAYHTVTDWWRRNRTGGERKVTPMGTEALEHAEPVAAAGPPDPEDAVIREDLLGRLRDGLAELSEREQEALALRFAGGLRAREVGEVLGISEGAVRMLVHRAVGRLRKVVAHE